MKSAYELAMERLNKSAPVVKLTDTQKKDLAELDSRYAAKVAEREIGLKDKIGQLNTAGEFDKATEMENQLAHERKVLQAELEEKKEQVRAGKPKRK
jgi:hypothetical protein